MQADDGFGQPFVVPNESPEARLPGEGAFGDPAPGQEDEAMFGVGKLDHMQFNALGSGDFGRDIAGIALVDVDQFDVLAGRVLDGLSQRLNLGAILFVGRGDLQRQQLAQGVDGQMELAALLPFVPVVPGSVSTLGCALHGLTIEDGGRRLGIAALGEPQDEAQIIGDGLEAASLDPTLGLLVDRFPTWEIMGQHAPGGPSPDHPAQGIEDFPQLMLALRRVFGHQREIGSHEGPFGVTDIGGVGLTMKVGCTHPSSLATPPTQVHNRL